MDDLTNNENDIADPNLSNTKEIDAALRPPSFADFTGQKKTIERLQVMVGAAAKREEH